MSIDFNAIYSPNGSNYDPAFASAWDQINSQLNVEGALTADINYAKNNFTDAYLSLPSLNADLHGLGIVDAAKSFVMTARTAAGAAETIGGFISAGAGRPRDQIVFGFTGSMIGTLTTAAIGAGAVTAGVGAAIVVGATVAVSVLEGIIGTTPQQGVVCEKDRNADYMLGQLCVSGQKVAPAAGGWRTFPDPTDPQAAGWFHDYGWGGGVDWMGAHYGYSLNANPPGPTRLIDWAYGNYQTFELYAQGQVAAGGVIGRPDFLKALAAAWRSNAEYGLNGINMQTDAQVLLDVVRKWNRSHAGPVINLGAFGDAALHQMVSDVFNIISTNDSLAWNGTTDLALNVGDLVQPPVVTPILAGAPQVPKVLLGTAMIAGAGAASLFAYAHLNHISFQTAAQRLWASVGHWFSRSHVFRENPEHRRVAFRIHQDSHHVVVLRSDRAVFFKYGERIVDFIPAPYQLTKIRAGRGDILIYTDQLIGM